MINKKIISSIAITSLFFGATGVFAASGDNSGPIKGVKHQINDSGQDVNISSGLIGEKYESNDSGELVNTAGGVKPILNDISGNEAEENIRDLIAKGIVHGDNHNQFNPDKMIKREELATMVTKTFDLQHAGTVQDFDDVPMNRWSYPFIEAAKDIFASLEPNSDKNFHPTAGIKREEATEVIIMAVMSKNPNVKLLDADAADQFLRSKISDTNAISISFRPYVATAIKNNLIEANVKGYFLPQNMLSRAEAATFLDHLFTNGFMSDDHSAMLAETKELALHGQVKGIEFVAGKTLIDDVHQKLGEPDAITTTGEYSESYSFGMGKGSYTFVLGEDKVVSEIKYFGTQADPSQDITKITASEVKKLLGAPDKSEQSDKQPVLIYKVGNYELKFYLTTTSPSNSDPAVSHIGVYSPEADASTSSN